MFRLKPILIILLVTLLTLSGCTVSELESEAGVDLITSDELGYFGNITAPTGWVVASGNDTLTLTSGDGTVTITAYAGNNTIDFRAVGGGGGNVTVAFVTIDTPLGTNPVADTATDTLTLTNADTYIDITGTAATDTIDFALDGAVTLDAEWNTIGEIEAVTSVNIIVNTEINSEAELEALLADVADVFTNNDLIPEANLDIDNAPTDEHILSYESDSGKLHWQAETGVTLTQEQVEDYIGGIINDGDSVQTRITVTYDDADNALDFVVDDLDSTLTQEEVDDFVALLINDGDSVHTRISITYDDANDAYDFVVDDMADDMGDVDTEVKLETALGDVTDVFTDNDTIPVANIHADITRDAEWDSEGEVEIVWGYVNIIIETEIDTEGELEALLGDVTDVFTDNDGALDDDDLSDNNLNDLADVNAGAPSDNDSLTWDNATSKWIPEAVAGGGTPDEIWDADTDTGIQVEEGADDDHIRMDVGGTGGDNVFLIHDTGILSIPMQAAARADRITSFQSVPHATVTNLNTNSEIYDIQGEYNLATDVYTCTEPGLYLVEAVALFLALGNGKNAIVGVEHNGVQVGSASKRNDSGGAANIGVFFIMPVVCGATDTLEVILYHNHGSAINVIMGGVYTHASFTKLT